MNLTKPDLDTKEYKVITLANGLRAMLVSDASHLVTLDSTAADELPEENAEAPMSESENEEGGEGDSETEEDDGANGAEKMAACALCVSMGSFSDPPELPGLAHFLEHMVFMGSAKHPKENAMDDFLKKRGGSSNAVTDLEHTTFHIECREQHLAAGMDLFAQFFIAPLLLREAMTREREAIESEFQLALPSDGSRFEQLLGSMAPSGHPAACFPWGNNATLQDNVDDDVLHRAVRDLWLRHYSAHRITLAVVARLPLDTLEEYVRNSFSDVPNNKLPSLDLSSHAGQSWGAPFYCLLWVKPIYDLCEVDLNWVLPPMVEEYESRPLTYLSSLMGHEGRGSLLSYLKKKVLALSVLSGNDGSSFEFNSVFSTFTLKLVLTEDGLNRLDEVLLAVFSYLAMLREHLPDQRCFEEFRDIASANFKYKDEIEGYKYAERLAEAMHIYKPEHLLTGDELFYKYNPTLITSLLEAMRPDNVNVAIHCGHKPDEFYDQEEPWFKTKYKKEELPASWVQSWMSAKALPDFHMPRPNPYIVRRFSLLESNEVEHPAYPEKILETPLLEVWYRQDLKFKRPIAHYQLYLTSPVAKATALNAALFDILSAFVRCKLEEELYPAIEAGYGCSVACGDFGLVLRFSGFDEKLPLLYETLLKGIRRALDGLAHPDNLSLFLALKANQMRDYVNAFLEPADLNQIVRLSLLLDKFWTPMEKLSAGQEITLDQLSAFSSAFFAEIRAQILVQGNVSREAALCVAHLLPEVLGLAPLKEKPKVRVWNMEAGRDMKCRVASFNTSDNNSVITNYFQSGPGGESVRSMCIIDLVMMLMDEPLFDSLRTQQQLGYDVSAEARDTFGIHGFSVTVHFQSTKFNADQVDDRIELFLAEFALKLRAIPVEELEEVKDNLCALKRVMDSGLSDEVLRNFAEITSGDYKFDRLVQEVEHISQLTLSEISDWFEGRVGVGANKKKLSIQVNSNPGGVKLDEKVKSVPLTTICPDPDHFIGDLVAFKAARTFYPPQKPS